MTHRLSMIALFASLAGCVLAQSSSTYVPGTTYQKDNSNYPARNPFYFEGRIDWNLLNITQPANTWEFMQRGIYRQDDLEDYAGAIADYRQSVALNNLANKSCQLVTTAPPSTGQLDPPPCIFIKPAISNAKGSAVASSLPDTDDHTSLLGRAS